jgi:hypothetical protein
LSAVQARGASSFKRHGRRRREAVAHTGPGTLFGDGFASLPDCTAPPGNPDGDGVYDDVNGNGRIDFADVIWLFNLL